MQAFELKDIKLNTSWLVKATRRTCLSHYCGIIHCWIRNIDRLNDLYRFCSLKSRTCIPDVSNFCFCITPNRRTMQCTTIQPKSVQNASKHMIATYCASSYDKNRAIWMDDVKVLCQSKEARHQIRWASWIFHLLCVNTAPDKPSAHIHSCTKITYEKLDTKDYKSVKFAQFARLSNEGASNMTKRSPSTLSHTHNGSLVIILTIINPPKGEGATAGKIVCLLPPIQLFQTFVEYK